jgi:hypothetical protein
MYYDLYIGENSIVSHEDRQTLSELAYTIYHALTENGRVCLQRITVRAANDPAILYDAEIDGLPEYR